MKKSSVSKIILFLVGLGLLILLAFAFLSPQGGRPQQGEAAPDFNFVSFDGADISLSDLGGQVVVLNFWASWCGPCRQEAPELQEVWESYKGRGVVFVGLSYQDAEEASRAFIEEFGITYPNGVDSTKIARRYGLTGVPETFVIDAEGKVAWFYVGEVQADELAQRLAQMIGP